ncbi:MAG: acylase [Fermentimonas sp.]|nr:acylase [Fermentimonas sp.]MDD4723590.1 acylase [Fermentimonas sp.]
MKTEVISFIFLALVFFSCSEGKSDKGTEILWDKWGVPHVYATDEAEMYYAFGWAQMQSHANLILRLYAESRGTGSEFFSEKYLESDRLFHLFNLTDSAQAQYERFTGDEKLFLDSFVRGLNDYAEANPEEIDEKFRKVLPVTAIDVLAHGKRVINLEFLSGRDIGQSFNELKELEKEITPGSNSYAIAPAKSESGNAMLVANPHLPWNDLYMFFEAHLNAPDFDVYGVTLVGMPVLNIAFNKNLGWTHTVNTIDASDRYVLTLEGDGYILDGEVRSFDEKSVVIKVLQDDSSIVDKEIKLKYSQHGPIIFEHGDKAYALRIAGLDNDSYFYQYHKMGKSDNFDEFEDALKMMQIPMFNVVYADKAGNIMYLFNGNVPERSEGDWKFWNDKVDGTRSDLIWHSYHDYGDLPKLFNPETGFVQNANDAPWTATYPLMLNSEDYPAYMSPKPEELPASFRAQRAINLIKDDDSISFEELVDYKLDTGMEVAERLLDDLLAVVEQYPDPVAVEAAAVLRNWDGETNTDSKGAVLFARWIDKLGNDMYAVPWSIENPVTTPDGLKDPEKAVAILVEAADEIDIAYGSMDVAWGNVNRFRVGKIEFPGNGGNHDYGVFRTMYFKAPKERNINYAFHGDTYVAVVEFGDNVRAKVLLSYGNSTQTGNRFMGDQLEMLSENQLRDAFLSKEVVLNNLAFKEELKH